MLDGLLGRGFASKCKSLIKLTKSRIDVIRRKRNATQKFLKKDMADLLANGLDVNAYGRAEGLLVELTLSSCYDFVEQCCDFLLKNLSLMQKQSGCPEECREAVSSIMFAAARFSDLPELRDLRHAFQERYGDSLDYFLNQEFREKLASKPITMEKKVHLMQDIASEFSIKWNARNFEQRMAKASVSEQDQLKNNVYHATDDKYSLTNGKEIAAKGDKLNLSLKEPASDGQKFRKVREANSWKRDELGFHPESELSGNDRKVLAEREVTISRKDYQDTPQRKKEDFISDRRGKEIPPHKQVRPSTSSHEKLDDYVDGGAKHKKVKEKSVRDREHLDASFYPTARDVANEKLDDYADGGIKHNKVKEKGLQNRGHLDTLSHPTARDVGNFVVMPPKCEVKDTFFAGPNNRVDNTGANSMGKVKSEADKKSYYNGSIPPPYVKPNIKVKDDRSGANSVINSTTPDFTAIPTAPSMHRSPSWDQRSEDVQIELSYPDQKTEDVEIARGNGHGNEKDYKYQDGITGYPLPKPRSHRRRHSKSRSTHDDAHHHEDDGTAKGTSRSRRREDQRRGLQVLFDDDRQHRDEEEKIIDKLLIHYSKKPSTYEDERIRRKSRSRHVNGVVPGVAESPLQRRERPEDEEEEVGVVPLPPRSISLPREQPSAPPLPTKVFARAASFQPDRSADARHVHPKLPDYDDLAARFAALKGR